MLLTGLTVMAGVMLSDSQLGVSKLKNKKWGGNTQIYRFFFELIYMTDMTEEIMNVLLSAQLMMSSQTGHWHLEQHQSAPDPANRFQVSIQRFYSKPAQLETQNILIAKYNLHNFYC